MLHDPATEQLHNNPNAYWCPGCWKWNLECSHLVEPLDSPYLPLNHFQYRGVTWKKGVLQVTMNTGERYQHFGVSRNMAIRFARNPENVLLKGFKFGRVRGRAQHAVGKLPSHRLSKDTIGEIREVS